MKQSPFFYSGTSGLLLPVRNKSYFPESFQGKSRLTYYASLFNSIEINSSFYKIPQPQTVERWALEVPDYFRFTFKIHRGITHEKGLQYSIEDLRRFLFSVSRVGYKKGCLLLQLPGGTKSDNFSQLEALLGDFRRERLSRGWKLAVEFRHSSWYMPETWELLDLFRVGLVYQDIPKSLTPRVTIKSKWIYLRYHGPAGDYRGSYSDELLTRDAVTIRRWMQQGRTVYAYFNNSLGEAINNQQSLKDKLISDIR